MGQRVQSTAAQPWLASWCLECTERTAVHITADQKAGSKEDQEPDRTFQGPCLVIYVCQLDPHLLKGLTKSRHYLGTKSPYHESVGNISDSNPNSRLIKRHIFHRTIEEGCQSNQRHFLYAPETVTTRSPQQSRECNSPAKFTKKMKPPHQAYSVNHVNTPAQQVPETLQQKNVNAWFIITLSVHPSVRFLVSMHLWLRLITLRRISLMEWPSNITELL